MKTSIVVPDVSVTKMITQVVIDQETHTLPLLDVTLPLDLDLRTWTDIEGAETMKTRAAATAITIDIEEKTRVGGEEM